MSDHLDNDDASQDSNWTPDLEGTGIARGVLTPCSVYLPEVDHEDGDVILESSDGVRFHVHRLFLRKASEMFADMFSLSDDSSSSEPIPMAENARTIDALLHFIYPTTREFINQQPLSFLENLLTLAEEKYFISSAVYPLKTLCQSLILSQENPLRAWALAVAYGNLEATRIAARRCVIADSSALEERVEELQRLDALTYHELLALRRRARSAAGLALFCVELNGSAPTLDVKSVFVQSVQGRNPFDDKTTADEVFLDSYRTANAIHVFDTRRNVNARRELRAKLRAILDEYCPL